MIVASSLIVRQKERNDCDEKKREHLQPDQKRQENEDEAQSQLLVIPVLGLFLFQSGQKEIDRPKPEADRGGFPQDLAGNFREDRVPGDVKARDESRQFSEDPLCQKIDGNERQKPEEEVQYENGAFGGKRSAGDLLQAGREKREEVEGISVRKGAFETELLDLPDPLHVKEPVVDDDVLPYQKEIDPDEDREPDRHGEPVLRQEFQKFDAFIFAHQAGFSLSHFLISMTTIFWSSRESLLKKGMDME